MRSLFYGYGNPGRRDDGLGIAFVEKLESWCHEQGIDNVFFDSNYQLNIEDADTIRHYDLVVFCDASQEDIPDFCFGKVHPSEARIEFSMHAVSPAFILDLAGKLFNTVPAAWLLHIKGETWEFKEGLTNKAEKNLKAALDFVMRELIPSPDPLRILKETCHSCP
ncbi:MAG: hydrogenase maturation protease [Chlorobi bacterium]|nr:hydrogenase maturation protease [Chlorobiota bacterium]